MQPFANSLQKTLLEKLLSMYAMSHAVAVLVPLLSQTRGNVYKKLRLEVPFSADEIATIAKHFSISLDEILGLEAKTAAGVKEKSIEVMQVVESFDTLTAYLQQAHGQLLTFRQMPGFSMTYVARDLPLFHYFAYPELGALKAITWLHENIAGKPKLKDVPESLLNAGVALHDFYKTTACTEIWSEQTLSNTLQNISYYYQVGVIPKTLALQLFTQLSALLYEQKLRVLNHRDDYNAFGGIIHSPFIMMSNGALLRIGEITFGMLAITSIQTIVVHEPRLLASLNTSIQWHLHHGVALHKASEAVVHAFFDILDAQIIDAKKLIQGK